ncbi:MAG: Ca-activated chloride channel [Candidatus Sumerlaeota bacterium]|nr:Ca-activated chloride channel [Candidatus Sumerlaeota bacterium]
MLDWRFLHPWFLLLLPLPVIWLVVHYVWLARRARPSVVFSDTSLYAAGTNTVKIRVLRAMPVLRAAVLLLGIVALARPQYGQVERRQASFGIDIAVALDISETMDYTDFNPNRLEVAKTVLKEFVDGRGNDRLSLVIFGTSAALLCPPTFDHEAMKGFIDVITSRTFANQDRMTAIGDGLGLAVSKLRDSTAKSKVAILLTDGENNSGRLQPLQAAEAAKALGVRVYTIGVGSNSSIRIERTDLWGRPYTDSVAVSLDEDTLKEIASITGGRYFRAANEDALRQIYEEIDKLEKTEIETTKFDNFDERFQWFWYPALGLLALEFLLRAFWLRRLP